MAYIDHDGYRSTVPLFDKIYLMNFFALIYFINKNMAAVEGDTPLSKDGASWRLGRQVSHRL